MPFAGNRATRYISPTKTPEYLAAGLPVVSTPVPDVVATYAEIGAVRIATGVDGWVAAVGDALRDGRTAARAAVDAFLARGSWDRTWERMSDLVEEAVAARTGERAAGLASLGERAR
jgi:glycosyltransferase involved in cell wall biosynthesis